MALIEPAPRARGFQLTGGHVLAITCAFFGAIIAVNIGFITMAYRTFSGEVADDPYQAGIAYNQTLAQRKAEAALGWRASIGALPDGRVVVAVADRDGRPLSGLAVSAKLERPATEAGGVTLKFNSMQAGSYETAHGGLSGAWDVHARFVDANGRLFEADRRLVWP